MKGIFKYHEDPFKILFSKYNVLIKIIIIVAFVIHKIVIGERTCNNVNSYKDSTFIKSFFHHKFMIKISSI